MSASAVSAATRARSRVAGVEKHSIGNGNSQARRGRRCTVNVTATLADDEALVAKIAKLGAKVKSRNTVVSERYRLFLDTWDQGFSFNHVEQPDGHWLEVVEGQLPKDLEGTYFRNGPGQFNMGNTEYGHPYDGDGLIASVAFRDGRAFFRSRFIRTPEYELESRAQQVLFRGSFAAQRPGGRLANAMNLIIKNNSNTNVVEWAGRLITMFEAAVPYKLDPATLHTLGPELLGGRIQPGVVVDMGSPAVNQGFGAFQRRLGSNAQLPQALTQGGGHAHTAHPHVDANTGRLCLWTYQMKPRGGLLMDQDTHITFWELAAMGYDDAAAAAAAAQAPLQVAASRSFVLQGFGFVHDFAVTKNYYVMLQPPVLSDPIPYISGAICAASSVRWRKGDPTLVHVIPRPGSEAERRGESVRSIPVFPATFVFHHANGFESEDGNSIMLDSIHYDALPAVGRQALAEQGVDADAGFRATLRRMTIDLRGIGRASVSEPSTPAYLELPCVNHARFGTPTRYVFGYSSNFDAPSIGITKVDMDENLSYAWDSRPGYMCLEPVFVPRPNAQSEDDGYILSYAFDAEEMRSDLLVLDALHLQQGPIARLAVPARLPHGLHGCFSPRYYGPSL